MDLVVDHQSVVVGVDGSADGWAALDWAVRQVAVADGLLVICYVRPLAATVWGPPAPRDDAEDVLATAVRRAGRIAAGERVYACMQRGDPATALTNLSAEARLLVVGAPARTTDVNRPGTSVVLPVVTSAHCPVVVVRTPTGPDGALHGHVLVAVDGGATDAALAFGFAFADAHDLPLAAVRGDPAAPEGFWFDESLLETHFVTVPPALELLEARTERWRLRYPRVPVKLAVFGDRTVDGLLTASRGAPLLVVSEREPDRLGPTARELLARAGCPIAVVRPVPSRVPAIG